MSTPGWYPDPAGGGGHRWWDGHVWTAKTSNRTGTSSSTGPGGGGRSSGGGRGPWGWILGGLALVLAIVVAIVGVLTRPSGPREITDGGYPTTSSTVSAWNDGQPQ
ncbi:MAG: DUF2510 domain-containing protein, partial [Propionibacteriales bacterium]|nr:DUF2510 domain-containing protein [Propionibacteriales bacterium]